MADNPNTDSNTDDDDIDHMVDEADRAKQEGAHKTNGAAKEEKKPKQADVLIALASECKLFHTGAPDDDAYADVEVDGHRETYRIRSKGFKQWLRRKYFEETKSGCNNDAMQVAVETIAANAHFEGVEREVHCRVAECDGKIYIDIGSRKWDAIEIDGDGWRIVDRPPVRFKRSPSTVALPVPQTGGSIEDLRPFCNVKSDGDFHLLVAFTLAAMRPNANYPVLVITGEQGTSKSTLVRLLQRLIDPRMPEQRSLPRDEDDLVTAAKGAHLLPYDNISGLPDWISDAFCRLATGGGAGKRKLYTDDDESLFAGRRPVILNGIEDIATRPDLIDRAAMLGLEPIPEDKRRDEKELEAEFQQAAPKVLGALLDGLVSGLKNLANIKLPGKPRMADFAMWAEACTRAYWPAGTFMRAYQENIESAVDLVLESSPVADAVRKFMVDRADWEGTAGDLLPLLSALVDDHINKERGWPKAGNALTNKLRRAAPHLRKAGIDVKFGRNPGTGQRVITITAKGRPGPEHKGKTSSQSSQPSRPQGEEVGEVNDFNKVATFDRMKAVMVRDNAVTVRDDAIVTPNPLKNQQGDGRDGRDGLLPIQSGGHSGPACAECSRSDGQLERCRADNGREIWLHIGCAQAFIRRSLTASSTAPISKAIQLKVASKTTGGLYNQLMARHRGGGLEMPKKPTKSFGVIVFSKEGKVWPDFQKLPDDIEGQELGVAQRFVALAGQYVGGATRIEQPSQDDHDFYIYVDDNLLAQVQCTEIVLREFVTEGSPQEHFDSRISDGWVLLGNGCFGLVDRADRDNILVKKISRKYKRYSKPPHCELWLLIFSTSGYPLGNYIQGGRRKTSLPVARAREFLEANGPGCFTRIFYFNLLTKPTLIWPVDPSS
jgi:hypothetical protein